MPVPVVQAVSIPKNLIMERYGVPGDFTEASREVQPGYLQEIGAKALEYLLDIIAQVAETMLSRLNVPEEEIEVFTKQIKERRMGQLFVEFKGYDVQEARIEWRKEGKIEGAAQKLISQVRKRMHKNMPMEEIAEVLEEETAIIIPIYDMLQEHADWDDERVYKELMAS